MRACRCCFIYLRIVPRQCARPERPPPSPSLRRLQLGSHELRGIRLDDIPLLEIREPSHLNPALEVLRDFADIVLEPPQRLDLPVEHHGGIPQDTNLGVPGDLAGLHVAPRDRTDFGDLEDLAHFRAPEGDLAELRSEHPDHRLLEVVLDVVDDLIEPQIDLLRLRDRKSTRLNSSHANISYAVFCLKKKKLKASQRNATRDYMRARTLDDATEISSD